MNKNINKIIKLIALLALLFSSCTPKTNNTPLGGQPEGTIAVSGAFALYPLMTRWAEEYQEIYPGIQFDVSAGGAGKGMTDVLTGAVEIGMVSRDISPEEEAKGAFWVPVAIDAVFPTINEENPVLEKLLEKPVTQEILRKIFITGEITTWGEVVGDPEITEAIHVYTRSDSCGAAETWAKYLGGTQEDLLGIGISSDPALLDAVVKDPLGIGYNNLNYAFDISTGKTVVGSLVPPIDVNQNGITDPEELLSSTAEAVQAVAEGNYPSPPARKLNLVTNGSPQGIEKDFLIWILTEGQEYISESGYIALSDTDIQNALEKVKQP